MLAVSLLLSAALAQAAPAPAAEPTPRPLPNGPVVVLETSMGTIKIGLHKDKAPISVENFLRYVRVGHYNNTIFHRVIPGFMVQGGGYDSNMAEKPVRAPIRNEASNGLRNSRGSVAMARTNAPDSATAQFFINVKDNHALDFGIRGAGYAVFGEVIEGMDVVDKITTVQTTSKGAHQNVPLVPIVIKSAREAAAAGAAPAPAAKPEPKPQPKASSLPR